MRIALAQLNPTVGDLENNARLIENAIARAADQGAELVVLPELAVIGYPPRDLLLKPAVIGECVQIVESLAARCTEVAAIIGYPSPTGPSVGRRLHNSAALCADGRILHRHDKRLLPTYDVFDEHRYFEPGPVPQPAPLAGVPVGISICEDLWNDPQVMTPPLYHENPIDELATHGAGLFINCAASPFAVDKHALRLRLMSSAARKHGMPMLFCNQVGGNDELVFDGCSCAVDANGELLARARAFEEDLLLVDVPNEQIGGLGVERASRGAGNADAAGPANRLEPLPGRTAAAHEALVLGLRDYCRKCGFDSVVLGLSGGIDSAVCACIAAAALGSENVRGIAMPSRYSTQGATDDARALAENLDIDFRLIPIEQPHAAFEALLAPHFAGLEPDVTEENIQARVRGLILMAFSNKFRSLLVSTGNKSELAVGYCTLYGDMAGGLAVLSDAPKLMVYDMARWINEDAASPLRQRFGKPVIPENTIAKPPSAELRPDQKDEDSLPPYETLDEIVERYVERDQSAQRIIAETGIEAETVYRVVRLIDVNEYKRKQAAPGLKITGRAFGVGRRMPIAQRYNVRHSASKATM